MKTVFFSDFDGTITFKDVGYSMFHHFSNGRNEELIPDWKAGTITSRECLTKEAEMISLSNSELNEYLNSFELDSGFEQFVIESKKNKTELYIVSDGLDIYIDYILKRHNLNDLNVCANHAYIKDNKMIIEFPVENKICQRCGICKGETIADFRDSAREELTIVFAGDGYSDICAVKEADVVFAKKDLKEYCDLNDLPYINFNTFHDISIWMQENGAW